MTPRTLNNNYKKCISNRTFELKNEGGFVFFFCIELFYKNIKPDQTLFKPKLYKDK